MSPAPSISSAFRRQAWSLGTHWSLTAASPFRAEAARADGFRTGRQGGHRDRRQPRDRPGDRRAFLRGGGRRDVLLPGQLLGRRGGGGGGGRRRVAGDGGAGGHPGYRGVRRGGGSCG